MGSACAKTACGSSQINTEEMNILDLCDDCLIEIFGHLNVFDLSLMAGVCKRFKEIASSVFIKKFKNLHLDAKKRHSSSLISKNKIRIDVFNGIVREFGPLINMFHITLPQRGGKDCSKSAIKAISAYCTKNLRHLDLKGFKIDEVSSNSLNSILNQLNSLRLEKCELDPAAILSNNNLKDLSLRDMKIPNPNFLNRCTHLGILFLSTVQLNAKFWNQHLPYLLEIFLSFVSVDSKRITNFFRRNHQLKRVFTYHYFHEVSVLESICKYLPNITVLEFSLTKYNQLSDRLEITPLNQLYHLSLFSKGFPMSLIVNKLFSHNNSLTFLRLGECIFDKGFVEGAHKLHRLKTLQLFECSEITKEKMDNLFPQLKQINYFHFSDDKRTIREVSQLLRNINRLEWLWVDVRHEDYIYINEYKVWMTELQQRVDGFSLSIRVTNRSKYRWMEGELGVLGTVDKLRVEIYSPTSVRWTPR